jgi:hypothetical protein
MHDRSESWATKGRYIVLQIKIELVVPELEYFSLVFIRMEDELKKLKVAELKEKLQALQLPTTGKKDELIARLLEHAAHGAKEDEEEKEEAAEDALAPPADDPQWLSAFVHSSCLFVSNNLFLYQ